VVQWREGRASSLVGSQIGVDEVGVDFKEVVLVEEGFESIGIVRANDFGKNVG